MSISAKAAALVVSVLATGLFACADPQATQEMQAKIDEIQAQQKDLMAKIDDLAKGQKEILAKAAAAPAPAAAAKPAPPADDPNKVWEIKVGNSYAKGPENAPVTIVEWSDFQCPFCARAVPLVHQIMDAYPDDVRFVFKNYPLPFHSNATPAAKAAIAAGRQGKFFEMHDKLFENYNQLSEQGYELWAGEIGLDVEKFKADLADPSVAAQVTSEMDEGRQVGVRGTPTFFINGKKPAGRSFDLYKQIIDEEIAKKK